MLRIIRATITLTLLTYLGFGAYLYATQREMIYHPSSEMFIDNRKSIYLDNGSATLKVWAANPGNKDAIMYFGGNSEAVGNSIEEFSRAFPNHTVYMINYRGYGGSTGKPSEAAFFADATWLLDHFETEHQRISIVGRSIGSGVGSYLAANRKLHKLILVTPFDSFLRVAQDRYPAYPLSIMLKDKFDSLGRAPRIDEPILLLIAGNDQLIPKKHSISLARAFDEKQISVHILGRTHHNNIQTHHDYYRLMSEFLD